MLGLVVIDDLDIFGTATFPPEQKTPLIVDADSVIAREIASLGFQSVPRRNSQIRKFSSVVQVQ